MNEVTYDAVNPLWSKSIYLFAVQTNRWINIIKDVYYDFQLT